MPTVEQNKSAWDGGYHWDDRGDEWSKPWGGTAMQWYGVILPRIHRFLDAGRILEIACGCGRWTQYLLPRCRSYVAVDLSAACIETCKRRFAGKAGIEYYVNDGKSLDMIADHSVDFVFSFDSLVHADKSVLQAYIGQFNRILTEDGVAFLHHSNLGRYRLRYIRSRHVKALKPVLVWLGILEDDLHWRDWSVRAEDVRQMAESAGLKCLVQETVNWRTRRTLNDCFTTLGRKSRAQEGCLSSENRDYMNEAEHLFRLSRLYTDTGR